MKRWFALAIAACVLAQADNVLAYGDESTLEGASIVYAGRIETLYCPVGGKYDCLAWPTNFYRMPLRGVCFTTSGFLMCGLSCTVLLGMDRNRLPTAWAISGDQVSTSPVQMMRCPSVY